MVENIEEDKSCMREEEKESNNLMHESDSS